MKKILLVLLLLCLWGCMEGELHYYVEPVKVTTCGNSEVYWVVFKNSPHMPLKSFYTLEEAISFKQKCDRGLEVGKAIQND